MSAVILSSIGTFELLLAIGQFFIVIIAILLIVSLFILRRREPDLPRPFAPTPILMRRCDARLRSASILRLYRQQSLSKSAHADFIGSELSALSFEAGSSIVLTCS